MQKVITQNTGYELKGAYLGDKGEIIQFDQLDIDAVKHDVALKRAISDQNPNKELQHIASLPWAVIHMVRRQNKWPNDEYHRKLAIKECVKMVYNGELRDLRIHGA